MAPQGGLQLLKLPDRQRPNISAAPVGRLFHSDTCTCIMMSQSDGQSNGCIIVTSQ